MQQLSALILVLFCYVTASAQERLSDIQTDSYILETYHSKIGDELYTIEIDQNDFVFVYVQSTLNNRKFLHRAYIPNSYNHFDIGIAQSATHMFFRQVNGIISYDFVQDQLSSSNLPAKWATSNTLWRENGNRCILNSVNQSTGENNDFLYEHGKGFTDINDNVYQIAGPSHLILRYYDHTTEEHTYDIENFKTGQIQRLIDPSTRTVIMSISGENVYYADSIGVYEYNIRTEEKTTLANTFYNLNLLELIIKGDNLFVINESALRDELKIDIIDLNTKTQTHTYNVKPEEGYNSYILHDNYLIMEEDVRQGENLVLLNHWDQTISRYEINPSGLPAKIDDDVLIYSLYDHYDNGLFYSRYQKIELGTSSHSEPEQLIGYSYQEPASIHSISTLPDGVLIEQNLFWRSEATRLLKVRDNQISIESHERELTNGFIDFSRFFLFDGKIHILDAVNLYRVDNDRLTLLNEEPLTLLSRTTYRIRIENDHIYWFEGESRKLFSYDGQSKDFIVAFDGTEHHRLTDLYDFAVLEECLYFLGQEDGLYRFDRITRELTELDKFIANNLRYHLYAYQNECYFSESMSGSIRLRKIDCEGTRTTVSEDLGRWHVINSGEFNMFEFGGEKHIWSDNGLHKIGSEDNSLVIETEVHTSLKYFLINDGTRILYEDDFGTHIYDGTESTTLIDSYFSLIRHNDDGTFFMYNSDERIQYHFDALTNELTPLPELDDLRTNAFVIGDKLFHQTRNSLYQVSKDLSSHVLVWNVFEPVNGTFATASKYGLSTLGDKFICVDPRGNIFQLEDLSTSLSTEFIDIDSTTYFLASNPSHGNQLYKMDFSSTILDHSAPSLITYPNPTSDYISLKEDALGLNYELFDSNGNKVQAGTATSRHIKIGEQTSGLYILKVGHGENVRSTKVIIQK